MCRAWLGQRLSQRGVVRAAGLLYVLGFLFAAQHLLLLLLPIPVPVLLSSPNSGSSRIWFVGGFVFAVVLLVLLLSLALAAAIAYRHVCRLDTERFGDDKCNSSSSSSGGEGGSDVADGTATAAITTTTKPLLAIPQVYINSCTIDKDERNHKNNKKQRGVDDHHNWKGFQFADDKAPPEQPHARKKRRRSRQPTHA